MCYFDALQNMCYYFHIDGHSKEDLIYEWYPGETEVLVLNKEMAQFGYKGSKLSSKIHLFSSG